MGGSHRLLFLPGPWESMEPDVTRNCLLQPRSNCISRQLVTRRIHIVYRTALKPNYCKTPPNLAVVSILMAGDGLHTEFSLRL